MAVSIRVTRSAINTSTGTQDFTVSGFGTPKAAMFILTSAVTDGTEAAHAYLSVGATDGTRQWCIHTNAEDAQTTTDHAVDHTNSACVEFTNVGDSATIDGSASFSAWITDGVRINWDNAPGTAYLLTVVLFGGSDLSAYAGGEDPTFLEIDVTAPGFEPDIVFVTGHGRVPNGAHVNWHHSLGAAHNGVSVTERSQGAFSWNGQTSTIAGQVQSTSFSGVEMYESPTAIQYGIDIDTFDANGFSLTPNGVNALGDRWNYLALKFANHTSWVGSVDSPTSTGDAAKTGVGFKPQFVMMFESALTAEDSVDVTGNIIATGISTITASEAYCNAVTLEDAATTSNCGSVSDDQAVNFKLDDGTQSHTGTFVSMDSDGFTINYSAANGTTRKWWAWAVEESVPAAGPVPQRLMIASYG